MLLPGKSSSFAKIMKVERVSISEELPVKLAWLKEHLRIMSGDFDNILALHLKAAIASAEEFTGLIICPVNFRLTGDFTREIRTGIMPISGVSLVWLDGQEIRKEIVDVENSILRFPADIKGESVLVEFTAGFSELPSDIAAAVLLIAAKLFENPSDSVEQLPKASTNLLRPHKKWGR